MTDRIKLEFAHSKQDRSKKTLENILEAAGNLLEQADPELLTSRVLAAQSGYSLGTLNKRLLSVDRVFLWLIEQGQKRQVSNTAKFISDFDPNEPLQVLAETLADMFFSAIKKVNPKIIRYYEHRIAIKYGLVEDYARADAIVTPFQEAARKNKTNTFRELDEVELRLILRSLLVFVERPFIYSDPIAGTMEHRRIIIDNFVRLLGRQ